MEKSALAHLSSALSLMQENKSIMSLNVSRSPCIEESFCYGEHQNKNYATKILTFSKLPH